MYIYTCYNDILNSQLEEINKDGRLSTINITQENILTAQPSSIGLSTHDRSDQSVVIDQKTVIYFKNLIRKYKKHIGEMDDNVKVCSGGLQQYLNRQSVKNTQREEHVQAQSKFECLPIDVRLHIFSYLSAKDLCRVSGVCRSWYDITEDNLLWQGLLDRDVKHWDVIGHNTNPSLYKEVESDWPNKEIYLRCSPEINRLMHQQNSMFNNISSILRYFIPKKTPTFAMFGPGLESQTSAIVRYIMNGPTFQAIRAFPGSYNGVGGGFTLKHESIQFHLSVLYSSTKKDREAQDHDRLRQNRLIRENKNSESSEKFELLPAVQDFCQMLDGFVYVVDSTLDKPQVENGLHELTAMISERWSATHVPVLVLSATLDETVPRVPCCDIIKQLNLQSLNRPWQVRNCYLDTLNGIPEGFTWLAEQTQRR